MANCGTISIFPVQSSNFKRFTEEKWQENCTEKLEKSNTWTPFLVLFFPADKPMTPIIIFLPSPQNLTQTFSSNPSEKELGRSDK